MAIREAARVQRARRHLAYHIFTRAAVKAHPGTLFVVRVRLSYGDVAETGGRSETEQGGAQGRWARGAPDRRLGMRWSVPARGQEPMDGETAGAIRGAPV
jgi:hypothetical protein